MLQYGPALIVRADHTIYECIALMKRHDVGSVLVVSDDGHERLVGVFTERDMLQKCDLVDHGDHWLRPVRTVMNKTVVSVDVGDLGNAGSLMLMHGLHHLPVVVCAVDGSRTVVGTISMRDVLRSMLLNSKTSVQSAGFDTARSGRRIDIQLFTRSEVFTRFMTEVTKVFKTEFRVTAHDELNCHDLKKPSLIVLDLDCFKPGELQTFVRKELARAQPLAAVVCFDPKSTQKTVQDVLARLKERPRFGLFAKPVNVLPLAAFLGNAAKEH